MIPPVPADAWRPGLEVGGHVLVDLLGRGGMGAVWRVQHVETGARRALKVLRGATHPEDLLRFQREVEALARLDGHPNLVRVHSAGVQHGSPWVVTELVEGGDLAARLKGGPLDARAAAALVRDLARGVAHAHARGVLHRDIKPANVLLDASGAPRLADFGLARLQGAESLTQSGTLVGTPAYMAPEQARGERADERTDVWGLGAVLYHALAGRAPGGGGPPMQVLSRLAEGRIEPLVASRPDVPPGLDEVCRRALRPSPAERWPDAASVAAALEHWLSGEPAGGRRPWAPLTWAAVVLLALTVLALTRRPPDVASSDVGAVGSSQDVAEVGTTRSPPTHEPLATPPPSGWPARMAALVDRRPPEDADVGDCLRLNAVTSDVAHRRPVSEEDEVFLERMAAEGFAEAQTAVARLLLRRGRDRPRAADLLWTATRNPHPDVHAAIDAWTLLLVGTTPSPEEQARARWLMAEAGARARRWRRLDLAASVAHASVTWGRTAGDSGRAMRLLTWDPGVAVELERRQRLHQEDPALGAILGVALHEGFGGDPDPGRAARTLSKVLMSASGPPREFTLRWLERHPQDPEWRGRLHSFGVPDAPRGKSLLEEWTDADAHFETVLDP